MVDVIGRAKVIITGDVDTRSVETSGGKIGSALRKGAVVGVAALGTLAVAGFKAFESFEEAEAQTKKLTQVLDNMGKTDAAPAVEKLADDLRKLTGVDDDVIKGGETILATFSQVADSAGEVGGTFERATKLAVDLAAAGFGDVNSEAVALGKALQDPIRGITALNRSGITFTDSQKKVIEALVKTGEVGKAQDLILKEVEKQVGGTAEAGATASGKIGAAVDELKESFGNLLNTLVGGDGKGGTSGAAASIDDLTTSVDDLAESDGWKKLSKALRDANKDVKDHNTWLGQWSDQQEENLNQLIDFPGQVKDVWNRVTKSTKNFFHEIEDAWDKDTKRIGKNIDGIVTKIGKFPGKLREQLDDWSDAGHELIQGFWDGLTSKVSGSVDNIVEGIRDALNDALGLPATFFEGRDGIPTLHIPAFAGGVRDFGGGLARVGEQGPETVYLPPHSDVYTATETKRMLTAEPAAKGGDTILQFYGPTSLSAARLEAAWANTYGTRFGA